jgi:Lon protease-like protein
MEHYTLPLFPLNTVLFPGQTLPLHIFEPRYRQMITDCLEGDHTFGVVLIREGVEAGGPAIPYDVGTTAVIEDIEPMDDGRMNIVTVGQERFLIQDFDEDSKPYLVGQVSLWPWSDEGLDATKLSQVVQQRLGRYVDLFARATESDIDLDLSAQHPATLAVLAAVILQIPPEQKQVMLELPSVKALLHHLEGVLFQENRALQIALASSHLQSKMDQSFSQN